MCLRAAKAGARVVVVDPRRTSPASFADLWLPLDVGSDIALANTVAHEIINNDLIHHDFVSRATVGFDEFAAVGRSVDARPRRSRHRRACGRPSPNSRTRTPRHNARSCAGRSASPSTRNAVDNVHALINLALLTGHVGRLGSGLNPLRGQNNVQGGGDMGALPSRLPGFQDLTDAAARANVEAVWGRPVPPVPGKHLTEMFDAMEHGELRSVYVLGENPAQSEADATRAIGLLQGLDHLVVQDLFFTRTAELADVVLPATAAWCETEGTVTSSERRVQRVRKAIPGPPGTARRHRDPDRVRQPPRPSVGRSGRRVGVERGPPRLPHARRDELRAARGVGGHPVAVPVERHARAAVPARATLGG